MHHDTRSKTRQALGIITLAFLPLLAGGCSRAERIARLLDQANRSYSAGELEKAEIEYKNVLKKDAMNAEAIARLGVLYHQQGRDMRAAVFLLKARELKPDNLDVRLNLALAQLGASSLKEAREEALYVLERRPGDDRAPLILVEASTTPKDLEDAQQRLRALPASATQAAPVIVALGNIAVRQNRPADAAAAFKQALATHPKFAAAHGALGLMLWSQKDTAGADAALKQAATLSPARSPRRIHYAEFKIQNGEVDAAKKMLEEMSRSNPDYITTWLRLAEIATTEKKLAEADAFLAKALAGEPQHPEAMLINARIRLAKGETEKAVSELERLQTTFPKSAQIAYQLSLAYIAAGDVNKAAARLSQVTAAAPDMVQAAITLAEIHIRKRDFAAAIALLKPLTNQRPDLTAARVMLADALRAQGNLDEAAAVYSDLQKNHPANAQVAFARGIVLLQQNKAAEARAVFEQVRQLQPDHSGALEQLVELDLNEKAFARARERIAPEIARQSQSAQVYLLQAKICTASDDIAGAETALKKALELQPNSPVAHYLLARLYVSSKQRDKAIANLQESTRQNPKALSPHLLLGVLLEKREDFAGARDAFEKALVIDPKSSLALNNLACLYSDRFDQPDKALDLAQRVRALMPNEPYTADTLGWALARKKQYAQALPLLQESIAKLPKEAEVHYHLGFVHYMLGDEESARKSLQRAIESKTAFSGANDAREQLAILQIDLANVAPEDRDRIEKRLVVRPDDPAALLRAGELARRNGDLDVALTRYQAVLQGNPKNAAALISTARVYSAKRDLPKALEQAKAARAAAPNNPAITHTVGRLAYEAGDHRWSASLLQEVSRARPDDAEVLFDWAEAAYSIGRVSDAETNVRRALETKNFTRTAAAERFLEMLSICANPANTPAAAAKIEQRLKAEPAYAPALMAMGLLAEQRSDANTACQNYEKLLSQFPEFSPAQRNLTILYAAQPTDNVKTTVVATKARQAYPADPLLARAVGILSYRQGEFGKAVNLLQESVAKNKKDGEALYYLGMAQGRLNKRSESKQTLQRALDLGLKDTLAAEAKKTIASAD
jgi:tetratricopeptide (TPR) repeat protein